MYMSTWVQVFDIRNKGTRTKSIRTKGMRCWAYHPFYDLSTSERYWAIMSLHEFMLFLLFWSWVIPPIVGDVNSKISFSCRWTFFEKFLKGSWATYTGTTSMNEILKKNSRVTVKLKMYIRTSLHEKKNISKTKISLFYLNIHVKPHFFKYLFFLLFSCKKTCLYMRIRYTSVLHL